MWDWIRIATAAFTGAGTIFALQVAAVAWWLPDQFSQVRASLEQAQISRENIVAGQIAISDQITGLSSRLDAVSDTADEAQKFTGYIAAEADGLGDRVVVESILERQLTKNTLERWRKEGKAGLLMGSVVNGHDFLYLSERYYPLFEESDREALQRLDASVYIWDAGIFPGAEGVMNRVALTDYNNVVLPQIDSWSND